MSADLLRLTPDQCAAEARLAAHNAGLPYNEWWEGVTIHEDEHRVVAVVPQITNWRIIETVPGQAAAWIRGWDYDGYWPTAAIEAAKAWVASGAEAPDGWKRYIHDHIIEKATT